MAVIDSHDSSNYDGSGQWMSSVEYQFCGQSFLMSSGMYTLTSARFYLGKVGSPTGNMYAKLYCGANDLGDNMSSTSPLLATSDAFSAASVGGAMGYISFTFSGAQAITLTPGYYFIICNYAGGDASNHIYIGSNTTTLIHAGERNRSNTNGATWSGSSGEDMIFDVNGTATTAGGKMLQMFN